MSLAVQAAWLAGPPVLLAEGPNGAPRACADLPVEAVRLRQPVAGATPGAGPPPGRPSTSPAGDLLLVGALGVAGRQRGVDGQGLEARRHEVAAVLADALRPAHQVDRLDRRLLPVRLAPRRALGLLYVEP